MTNKVCVSPHSLSCANTLILGAIFLPKKSRPQGVFLCFLVLIGPKLGALAQLKDQLEKRVTEKFIRSSFFDWREECNKENAQPTNQQFVQAVIGDIHTKKRAAASICSLRAKVIREKVNGAWNNSEDVELSNDHEFGPEPEM